VEAAFGEQPGGHVEDLVPALHEVRVAPVVNER
jgi:hypothetical protein